MSPASSSSLAKDCDSKRIAAVQVYQVKLAAGTSKYNIRLYTMAFLLLYVYQIVWVASTIGQPYRQFLEKADKEGFQVMQGSTRLRAELEYRIRDLNDPTRRTKKIGWTDWMDMDIEELAAEKKRDKERSVLDSLPKHMRVPSKYTAAFWPSFLLGVLAVVHALVLLMQYWSVTFNVWLNYREIDADRVEIPERMMDLDLEDEAENLHKSALSPSPGRKASATGNFPDRLIKDIPSHLPTHARVIPAKGRHVLVPLEYYPTLGMTFEYHRRRYVYQADNSTWSKVRCRTDFALGFLEKWTGFPNAHRVIAGQIRFGPNMFSVREPSFFELYEKQLLNPFSVFQIFCVLLWAIDDYIIFSVFNLFMVLVFEFTVVMQRLTSMRAVRGMGNPIRRVLVYRAGQWTAIDTTELLPGDLMSLTLVKPHHARPAAAVAERIGDSEPKGGVATKEEAAPRSVRIEDDGGDITPADVLLLRGSTVVNEASLTGESVPQMKEGLSELEAGEHLDMKNRHKMNVCYAGTKMLQCKGTVDDGDRDLTVKHAGSEIPNPPDNGCLCFVLRTGFASAQGKLVRMIEGSQEKVKGHERETGLLLLLLCFFAVISSGYVLYHGSKNEKRSKYELLLHCILIVTSVIRPELPMQMAMAVNNSIMTLMKMHVFCTEPYRVPIAGKLDACLFDKTGTLTTDELVAVGVCEPPKLATQKGKESDDDNFLTPMAKLSGEAALVLAGCHSLIVVDDETQGDPLESASMNPLRWHISSATGHAEPKPATEKKPAGKAISLRSGHQVSRVEILTRHHFSSKLQRMSCVINASGRKYAVAKGSPEAIGRLLESKPAGYDDKSEYLAKQGYRVISLAFKVLESPAAVEKALETRASCEEALSFAGFIAFTCMVRKDTADVLRRLKEGGMSVAMVTGDALLTAIHVAKEVGICEASNPQELQDDPSANESNEELRALLESKRGQKGKSTIRNGKKKSRSDCKPICYLDATDQGALYWRSYETGDKVDDYVADCVQSLAIDYNLATTGQYLEKALEQDTGTAAILGYIKVFARMTPDAKETVIECLHSIGALCLMCGDGANDVGALKQADVGVALLSGFGNVNVAKDEEPVKKPVEDTQTVGATAMMTQEYLDAIRAMPVSLIKMRIRSLGVEPNNYPQLVEKDDLVKLFQIKSREFAVKQHEKKMQEDKNQLSKKEMAQKQKQEWAEKQKLLQIRIAELEAKGESYASWKALREFYAAEKEASKRKAADASKFTGVEGSAAALIAQLEEMEKGDLPMIKLGDASIAAPFTSKMPSIKSCVDIVRQGRCTLVSSIQMYQIMSLQCLISSYSLSALYLDGVKYADGQITAMGLLGSVSFMSVSRSKPLDKLSSVRPLNSIFHPALFASLLGQFAIHFLTMLLAVYNAKKYLPEDYEPDLDGHFKPGILNTVVFLVSSVQQVTVFVVNLQGRPFMTGVTENRPLLWSLVCTFILTFMFASESVPSLNRYFQLVAFPDEPFRNFILAILVADLVATFAFDRLMKFIFCRNILMASFEESTWSDVYRLARTFAVVGFLMRMFLGSDEAWDKLLAMEQAAANATNHSTAVIEAVVETINVSASLVRDEF